MFTIEEIDNLLKSEFSELDFTYNVEDGEWIYQDDILIICFFFYSSNIISYNITFEDIQYQYYAGLNYGDEFYSGVCRGKNKKDIILLINECKNQIGLLTSYFERLSKALVSTTNKIIKE